MSEGVIPDPFSVLECDHCGTVARALTIWSADVERECPCLCHEARRYDRGKGKVSRGGRVARQRKL